MAILTGFRAPEPLQWVVWDSSDEALSDVTALIGWTPPVVDGALLVRLSDGTMQPAKPGWAVYVVGDLVGVAAAGVVATWRPAA